MLRLLRKTSWGERLQVLGYAVFFGSILLGLPAFGIGWNEPHPEYPNAETQLARVPAWLGIIAATGMALVFVGAIVRSFRER